MLSVQIVGRPALPGQGGTQELRLRKEFWLPLSVAVSIIGGCAGGGGGGGGIALTPTPTPAPVPTPTPTPPPPNLSFDDLHANQTFSSDDAAASATFDLVNKKTTVGTAAPGVLSVAYDVAAATYTITSSGRSATFGAASVLSSDAGQTTYQTNGVNGRDTLELVKAGFGAATKYVRLGFWQHDVQSGSQQDVQFDAFAFGFPTASAAVPRTGAADYDVTVFGLATTPGIEAHSFAGGGAFSVDFLTGNYSVQALVTETGVFSGAGRSGGGIRLNAAGQLSASDGTFSGNALYSNSEGFTGGQITGRLYGPGAEEVGASFSGRGADGSAFNGALAGPRSTTSTPLNQTLTNFISQQIFFARGSDLLDFPDSSSGPGGVQVRTRDFIAQLNQKTATTFTFDPGTSEYPNLTYSPAVQVASADPNFTAYQQISNGQPVRLSLYKPGGGNSELALTYSSFGIWNSTIPFGLGLQNDRVFFVYGVETPARLLTARTGSAHYAGVVYGAAETQATRATYDVRGASVFDVDFTRQTYTGGMAMQGRPTSGASIIEFGSYDFAGSLGFQAQASAIISRAGVPVGAMTTTFYGPNGEEIAGPFTIRVPTGAPGAGTTIAGVTVAKR